MTEYPAVLTALVPAAIRTALSGRGVRFCREDMPDPAKLLDTLSAIAADCMILHMSVADNFGRRKFFREVQKRKSLPVIVIGSKSDAADDGVKKLIRDALVTAVVTDSRNLVDVLLDALKAVEPMGIEVGDSLDTGPVEPLAEAPEAAKPPAPAEPSAESQGVPDFWQEPDPQPLPETPAEPEPPSVPEPQPEPRSQPPSENTAEPSPVGKKPTKKQDAPRKPKKASAPARKPEPPKFKPPKPSSCTTVAVFETLSGGGCTWTAATIAAWLSANRLRTALVGEADLRYLPPEPALDAPYSFAGVDVYCGGETVAEVMRGGYDYVVVDTGAIVRQNDGAVLPTQQQAKLDELTRAAVRVFVADAGRTRWIACESVLHMFREHGLRMSIALVRSSSESQHAVRHMAKGQQVVDMPFLADPFARSPERDAFCSALFDYGGGVN